METELHIGEGAQAQKHFPMLKAICGREESESNVEGKDREREEIVREKKRGKEREIVRNEKMRKGIAHVRESEKLPLAMLDGYMYPLRV